MRRLLVLCSAVWILAYGAFGASAATIGKDRLRLARTQTSKGDELVNKSEYAGAERKYRSAIETEPLLPTAYLGLGKALVGQQRYDEALAALEEAERRFVEWEQTIQIGDMQKRQVAERQLLSINDLSQALNDRGGGSSSTLRSGPAGPHQMTPEKIETEQFLFREHFEGETFQAIPAHVFYLEGIAYLRTNRRALGIEALEVCLLIDPGHELAHYNLAVALFTRGELEEAKQHLDAAVEGGAEPHAGFVADLERELSARQLAQSQN